MVKTKTKLKLINFKVSEEDYLAIKAKADLYEDGNVSLWLRKQGKSDPNGFTSLPTIIKQQEIEITEEEWPITDTVTSIS